MAMTEDERRAIVERLVEIRTKLHAIEEQINLTEWKTLFKEKLRLERQLTDDNSDA